MHWKPSSKAIFTLVYLLLAAIFLTKHLTRVENFKAVLGDIEIKGSRSLGTTLAEPKIRRIGLDWNIVEIDIRSKRNVVLTTQDGIRHRLGVLGWRIDHDTLQIEFTDGVGLLLQSQHNPIGLRLIPTIPASTPPVQELELPLRPKKGFQIDDSSGYPVILNSDKAFSMTLNNDSRWDIAAGKLILTMRDDIKPNFELIEENRYVKDTAVDWLQRNLEPSQENLKKSVDQWLEKVREGWSIRWNLNQGKGVHEEGIPGWRDFLVAALLTDTDHIEDLSPTLRRKVLAQNSWFISPYLGDIVNQSRAHDAQIRKTVDTLISNRIADTPSYDIPSGITYLIDANHPDEAEKLVASALKGLNMSISNGELIDRISLLQEAVNLGVANLNSSRISNLIEELLLERIKWRNEGLWLLEHGNLVDTRMNITTSRILYQQAEYSDGDDFRSIGRQIMISTMAHTDRNGLMARTLSLQRNGEIIETGSMNPEEFYPVIVGDQAYPRHRSLAKVLSRGGWMLTCAEETAIRNTEKEIVLTFKFRVGGTHHVAVKGIKAFDSLILNGIRWNPDPNFQRYYAGWFYDEASQTLFAKIYHRNKSEIIRILYE